ncbi:MAG: hypothetical protein KA439_12865 [Rhizobacter sp.]|jgi:hypothetical protein|nr:hypothetical protein [Rhizobacter sp.]MBP6270212.1 hypothetical protein [Rhizobacter sp.]HOX67618.1 hypothetical protein [Burkholderiaceae bacterium]
MSVSSIPAVSRVEPAASSARPSDTPQRPQSEQSSPAVGHKFLEEPEPRRFPWLSWETRELEVASKQPSPYGNIPLLGKELDRQV